MNRILLVLVLVMSIGVRGYGQTSTLIKKDAPHPAAGEPVRMTSDGGTSLQATHELRQTIYINPTASDNDTKLLLPQTDKVCTYRRWFRYDKDTILKSDGTTFGFTIPNGTQLKTSSNGESIDGIYTTKSGATPTVPRKLTGTTVACDAAKKSSSNMHEPTLAYRII